MPGEVWKARVAAGITAVWKETSGGVEGSMSFSPSIRLVKILFEKMGSACLVPMRKAVCKYCNQ